MLKVKDLQQYNIISQNSRSFGFEIKGGQMGTRLYTNTQNEGLFCFSVRFCLTWDMIPFKIKNNMILHVTYINRKTLISFMGK